MYFTNIYWRYLPPIYTSSMIILFSLRVNNALNLYSPLESIKSSQNRCQLLQTHSSSSPGGAVQFTVTPFCFRCVFITAGGCHGDCDWEKRFQLYHPTLIRPLLSGCRRPAAAAAAATAASARPPAPASRRVCRFFFLGSCNDDSKTKG